MQGTTRNQGLDLLRIIAMIMVVSIHYFGWGGIASAPNVQLLNLAFSGGVAVAANCAVNCFYLISGFYIKEEETIPSAVKRIKRVWVPTVIYSVTIPLLLLCLGKISLKKSEILLLFFPFMSNQYWFSTCFIAMAMLTPFLTLMLRNIADRKMLVLFAGIMVFLDCIQPVLGYNAFSNIGYGIIHALTMYTIGYVIKQTDFKINPFVSGGIYVACVGVVCVVTFLSICLTGDRNRTIADYNAPMMVIQSAALFLCFKDLKVRTRFSAIAPYIFGVYLLNDNQYAREILWKDIFGCDKFYGSPWMPLHYICVVICFMIGACCIEWIRINLWKAIRKMFGFLRKSVR